MVAFAVTGLWLQTYTWFSNLVRCRVFFLFDLEQKRFEGIMEFGSKGV
jgi:hypothetical protein